MPQDSKQGNVMAGTDPGFLIRGGGALKIIVSSGAMSEKILGGACRMHPPWMGRDGEFCQCNRSPMDHSS